MNENIRAALAELMAIGGVHPHLSKDHADTIEIHPIPQGQAKAAEVLRRHGLMERRPGIWGQPS